MIGNIVDKKTGKIVDCDAFDLSSLNIPQNFDIHGMDIKIFWEFNYI